MVLGARLRSFRSSIMRWRSGVMTCAHVEVKGGSRHHGLAMGRGVRPDVTKSGKDLVYRTRARKTLGLEERPTAQGSTAQRFSSTPFMRVKITGAGEPNRP